MKQTLIVYGHLRKGPITPMQALSLYSVGRLSARIYDLRRAGFRITSKLVTVRTRRGRAVVAQYRLQEAS